MGQENGGAFSPGPMALIVDGIVGDTVDCSHIEFDRMRLVTRSRLSQVAKQGRFRPHQMLPGVKLPAGTLRKVLLKGSIRMIKSLIIAYPQAMGALILDALAPAVSPAM